MKKFSFVVFSISFLLTCSLGAVAEPKTGERAARDYFKKRKQREVASDESTSESRTSSRRVQSAASADRYLALHFGTFLKDDVYKWGADSNDKNVGDLSGGVTYRIGEWTKSMDLMFRAELASYQLQEGRPMKLSFMPVVTFPDVRSEFPLYFGAGVGAGVFLEQIDDESDVSLDYQLIIGARMFNVWDSVGLSVEYGLKNHLHLLSNGQMNATYISAGTVFNF